MPASSESSESPEVENSSFPSLPPSAQSAKRISAIQRSSDHSHSPLRNSTLAKRNSKNQNTDAKLTTHTNESQEIHLEIPDEDTLERKDNKKITGPIVANLIVYPQTKTELDLLYKTFKEQHLDISTKLMELIDENDIKNDGQINDYKKKR